MFKIKVNVIDQKTGIGPFYVKKIKRGSKNFAGTIALSDAKAYQETKIVTDLLNFFTESGIPYELITPEKENLLLLQDEINHMEKGKQALSKLKKLLNR